MYADETQKQREILRWDCIGRLGGVSVLLFCRLRERRVSYIGQSVYQYSVLRDHWGTARVRVYSKEETGAKRGRKLIGYADETELGCDSHRSLFRVPE